MSNRVTESEVEAILPDTDSSADLSPFITMANLIVTQYLASDDRLSDTELAEIERWLSAHLYASTMDRQAKSEKTLDASITYLSKEGLGLDGTTYGQNAKLLDVTGALASIGRRAAKVEAVTSFD